MGKADFSDEFKRDAVAQITERGYAVAEVSQRLGFSQHSPYACQPHDAHQPFYSALGDGDVFTA